MNQREIHPLQSLEAICRRELSQVEGMASLERVVVELRPIEPDADDANWTISRIVPKPSSRVLREARDVIARLRSNYGVAA